MENERKEGTARRSRWNPTKDQITMLENLYKQGIRAPSLDQIQLITGSLREYGHIECKNVYYWFQNHNAKYRRKLKQEGIPNFHRLLHKPSRFCYTPSSSNGDHRNRHGSVYTKERNMMIPGGGYEKQASTDEGIDVESCGPKTLPLFPLQPLNATNDDGVGNSSFEPCTDSSLSCFQDDGGGREQPFIDFFSVSRSS